MRAGAILEGLSTLCQVYLLIVPIQDPRRAKVLAPTLSWSVQQRVMRFRGCVVAPGACGGLLQNRARRRSGALHPCTPYNKQLGRFKASI